MLQYNKLIQQKTVFGFTFLRLNGNKIGKNKNVRIF